MQIFFFVVAVGKRLKTQWNVAAGVGIVYKEKLFIYEGNPERGVLLLLEYLR